MSVRLQLKFTPKEASDEAFLERQFLKHAGYQSGTVVWVKKSLDSRGRNPLFLISADVYSEAEVPQEQGGFILQNVSQKPEVHIIGAGPAGLYAALQAIELGYKPVIIERGKGVKERRRDLAVLNKEKTVNPDSNYCFGEGGAGTYSDGKLYTRSNKRGPVQKVLQSLVDYGAKDSILAQFAAPTNGEMITRRDMVEDPPDILVTNYSMLNVMLMRDIESDIFEQTRQWLTDERNVFNLVVDELHLYRGTQGSEVAMIIRNLLLRLGLEPDSPQLRCIGTSASLDSGKGGKEYLQEFFGVDKSSFLVTAGEPRQISDAIRLPVADFLPPSGLGADDYSTFLEQLQTKQ